jgi:hypothetical protein
VADGVTAELVGVDELARGADQLADRIGESADAALERVGAQIAQAARARMPHGTGRLAGGVAASRAVGGVQVGHVGGVPYAGFIEFGGHGRAYVPGGRYLFPVAQQAEPLIQAAGELAARQEIARMRWPTPR